MVWGECDSLAFPRNSNRDSNTATLITNQPDYCRWTRTRQAPLWTQLISNPIAVTLSASLGILATSAINNKYGTDIWYAPSLRCLCPANRLGTNGI